MSLKGYVLGIVDKSKDLVQIGEIILTEIQIKIFWNLKKKSWNSGLSGTLLRFPHFPIEIGLKI